MKAIFLGCCMSIFSCYADKLDNFMEAFTAKPYTKQARVAFCIADSSGNILASYEENRSMLPNSICKLLTTAAALEKLGSDFRFCTELLLSAPAIEGSLEGDVIIYGDGDPSFAYQDYEKLFYRWACILKEKNIRCIKGNIVGNGSCFDTAMTPPSWLWEDVGNYYGAGASGLNFHENMYTVCLKLGSHVGDVTTIVSIHPPSSYVLLSNEVVSGPIGSGDRASFFGGEYAKEFTLRGSVPLDHPTFTLKGSISNPALWCARCFKDFLQRQGIEVRGEAVAVFDIKKEVSQLCIDKVYSAPLRDLVSSTHQRSMNLYAECLLKKLGEVVEKQGNLQGGLRSLTKYLQSLSVSLQGCQFFDGSGLSTKNLITAKMMVDFLSKLSSKDYFSSFFPSLPSTVPGSSSRVARVFSSPKLQGRVHAKSGFSSQGESFAGFLLTQKGEMLRFCCIANHSLETYSEWRKDMQTLLELFVD